jgi:hypothetical protein
VVQQLIDAFNAADMDRIMDHFVADAIYHNIGGTCDRSRRDSCRRTGIRRDGEPRRLASSQHGGDDSGVVLTERVDRFLINGNGSSCR